MNKSDEEKYTFENLSNIININVDDNFDLDEFIDEEDNRLKRRNTDLSTTNVSFFNINKDEVLNLDFNHFLRGNLDDTKAGFSNRIHSNSVNTAKHTNTDLKAFLSDENEDKNRVCSEKNLLDSEDLKIIQEVRFLISFYKKLI